MKNYIKNNLEAIEEYLNGLNTESLVSTWNEYTREHDQDHEIYYNDEDFFQTFFDGRLMEAIRAISFGEYRYQDGYIHFDGYANLETTNSPEDWIDISELAEAILNNPQDFYDIELEDEGEGEDEDETEEGE